MVLATKQDEYTPTMSAELHIRWRVRPLPGPIHPWRPADSAGREVRFPVVTTFEVRANPETQLLLTLAATVDLRQGSPAIVDMRFVSERGLELAVLQSTFKWQTSLRVVTNYLLAADDGSNQCYDTWQPLTGVQPFVAATDLDDEFLEQIAQEYLEAGRGYSAVLSSRYGISKRSAVRWVEKARARGILTKPSKTGAVGGQIVPRSERMN